jgi:hypothetical protein
MIAADLARTFDPVLLARDVGLDPDPWQANLLRERPRRSLLLCARQTGKSTATALTALWTAIFEPPALVVIVSPSQRQSAEMFRSLMAFYSKLRDAPELRAWSFSIRSNPRFRPRSSLPHLLRRFDRYGPDRTLY